MVTYEACVENMEGVLAARFAGAHRIELCSDLARDGLTPPVDLMLSAREFGPERLHVLIRCRAGNFVYTDDEVSLMVRQIGEALDAGADGVVIGALTPEGDIDLPACRRMVAAAEGMSVTFHRAFDVCRDPFAALEDIVSLGCDRILTSGQAPTAEAGIPLLRELVLRADGRIIIMPGAGVTPANRERILLETGAKEIHGTHLLS